MFLFYELLFRRIFEKRIHIQTQIRENLILALASNQWFFLVLIKVLFFA